MVFMNDLKGVLSQIDQGDFSAAEQLLRLDSGGGCRGKMVEQTSLVSLLAHCKWEGRV